MVDLTGQLFSGKEPLPPTEQLKLLRRELRLYDPSLLRIPAMVVANKTDAISQGAAAEWMDCLRCAYTSTALCLLSAIGCTLLCDCSAHDAVCHSLACITYSHVGLSGYRVSD